MFTVHEEVTRHNPLSAGVTGGLLREAMHTITLDEWPDLQLFPILGQMSSLAYKGWKITFAIPAGKTVDGEWVECSLNRRYDTVYLTATSTLLSSVSDSTIKLYLERLAETIACLIMPKPIIFWQQGIRP